MDGFEAAVDQALATLSPTQLRQLAELVGTAPSDEAVVHAMHGASGVEAILAAVRRHKVSVGAAASYLRGVAAGCSFTSAAQTVEVVWSGPSSARVPVRSTAQVIADLVGEARRELLLVTYSARMYKPIVDALGNATARGVDVVVLVETLQGAAGLLAGPEPASAFRDVAGVRLWHWPAEQRTKGARMHAKLAVADRVVLFASSVNLTQSGVEHSMEAGVLVRGGSAPARAAEHIEELYARGILRPLTG